MLRAGARRGAEGGAGVSDARRHTPDMGEISGFGGGYESLCQDMLEAGVWWLEQHRTVDVKVLTNPQIYGIIKEGTPETKELSDVVVAALKNECTGAMHHCVMALLAYIAKNGWDAYCAELRKSERGEK